VGLKRRDGSNFTAATATQQSHHCGIETKMNLVSEDGNEIAAIAPLWD